MKIVEFYRGERGNQNGDRLDDILKWSDGALDMDHDYVQWMFPLMVPSGINGDAPVLTEKEMHLFRADPDLKAKVIESYERFLDFLGFRLEVTPPDDPGGIVCLNVFPLDATDKRPNPQWWLNSFNHTMLRVTRVLKSLGCLGLGGYALAFYAALQQFKHKVSPNTWGYWHEAAFSPFNKTV